MRTCKNMVIGIAALMVALPVPAKQGDPAPVEARRAAEEQAAKEASQLEEANRVLAAEAAEMERLMEANSEEAEVQLREAERRMALAAQQVAELSMRQLPHIERIERVFRADRGPVLGITIGATDEVGPVEGVAVLGVTPGGAAAEAGLRAGDVITSINGESLTAENAEKATGKLLDVMKAVENGDELELEYLRNGKPVSVALTARPISGHVFAYEFDGDGFTSPNFDVHVAPGVRRFENFMWAMHEDGFGDMEMVKLTERLGKYFGTDKGLLVIRAPGNEDLKLEDGDVIL
ncbi:MAG: PDZ domain-containing protein, partial [Gammaproteobacteria bacterium]|nr:PDZ domain-containing protein [Gammaproteobacteria bacterium]